MTRGNQRDTDRARAEARANAGKSNSTLKDKESVAAIMRQKQEAAEAKKKAAEQQVSSQSSTKRSSDEQAKKKEAEEREKAERIRRAREAAEEAIIREQEEARAAAEKAREAREAERQRQEQERLEKVQRQLEATAAPPAPAPPAPAPPAPAPPAPAPPVPLPVAPPNQRAQDEKPPQPSQRPAAPNVSTTTRPAAISGPPPGLMRAGSGTPLPSPTVSTLPPGAFAHSATAPPGLTSRTSGLSTSSYLSASCADEDHAVDGVRVSALELLRLRQQLEDLIDLLNDGEAATLYLDDSESCVRIQGPRKSVSRARSRIEGLLAAKKRELCDTEPSSNEIQFTQHDEPRNRQSGTNGVHSMMHDPGNAAERCWPDVPMRKPSNPLFDRTVSVRQPEPVGVAGLASPQRSTANGNHETSDGAGGEEVLEKLLSEDDGEAHAVMEIDIPRECVGKIIGAGGAVIRSIRESTQANIKLTKEVNGDGVMVVTGTALQLERVAKLVQHLVAVEHSDPDFEKVLTEVDSKSEQTPEPSREGPGEDYIMLLPPHDAVKLTGTRELSAIMRLAGVKMQVNRSDDGWVKLVIRGAAGSIENAKKRIEALIVDELESDQLTDAPPGTMDALVPHGGVNSPVPELLMGEQANGEFRIEIELTNKDQVGAVIGEAGRTINSIRSSSGADIQVEQFDSDSTSTQRKMVIVGLEAQCMCARKLVYDVLRSNTGKRDYSQEVDEAAREGGGLIYLTIPRHLVGRVIGKRGATIKELRELTNAVIELSKDSEGTGTVTISGSPENVRDAREAIEDLTQEDLPIEVQQTLSRMLDEVLCINVPANRVGKVIGSRGAVIQALRQETGASIDLQKNTKDSSGPATITLRGSMEEMLAAKSAIQRIVNSPD